MKLVLNYANEVEITRYLLEFEMSIHCEGSVQDTTILIEYWIIISAAENIIIKMKCALKLI